MCREWLFALAVFVFVFSAGAPAGAEEFSGGGGSIVFGTGYPNSIDAVSALAGALDIKDETGNFLMGIQGFYQGDRFRLGGTLQAQGWAGVNAGSDEAEDDAAGVAALVGGLYGTYTIRHDRVLINAGAVVGAGRCLIGYSLADGIFEENESVGTFYLEPQVSVGVAATRWFGVEFQLSAPIFILTDDLVLAMGDTSYKVDSNDMAGVTFAVRLTFGRIAEW
jgi:hypothetical protein